MGDERYERLIGDDKNLPKMSLPKCPTGNEILHVCISTECSKPSFTCNKKTCGECAQQHKLCNVFPLENIYDFVVENIEQNKSYLRIAYEM